MGQKPLIGTTPTSLAANAWHFSLLLRDAVSLIFSEWCYPYQFRPEAYLRQAAQPRRGPKCSRPEVNISRRALRVFDPSCSPYVGERSERTIEF